MSSITLSSLAGDVIHIFDRTMSFFQSIGIIQDYSFSHSDVFFSHTAEKYLENFVSLLEEIKDVLNKLQVLQKQAKPAEVDKPNPNSALVSSDLITASQFISGAELFVTQQMITSHNHEELQSFIAPQEFPLTTEYNVPEIIQEPTTQSSWTPPEEKDEEQEKENVEKTSTGSKDKLQCSVCNKVLCSKTSLNFHMATHTGQKLFCCEHCGKLFTTNLNLSAHLTRQHNLNTESASSCKECGKLFVRKSALETHLKCHLGVRPWPCGICSKSFTQKVTRDTHELTHTGDYRFRCDECGKNFPTRAKLNYHMKSHREPQFSCQFCDKKFCTRQNLTAHLLTHDVRRPDTAQCRLDTLSTQVVECSKFNCGQCGRSFASQHALSSHEQRHNSARYRRKMAPRQKHCCGVCGREFLLKRSLSHHQRQKHSSGLTESQQRPFGCHLCHKSFTLRAKARLHMQTHTQEAQHGCEVCGRLFQRKDSLRRHMVLHAEPNGVGVTRQVCAVCGHISLSASAHRQHSKTHSVLFKCTRCDAAFKSKAALTFHTQAAHQGNFKFQCNMCGKQFVRKCHYRGHLLSHSSDRPYRCDNCGKGFKDNKTCREHTKRVHSNKTRIPPTGEQISANQMAGSQITANEMADSQMAIHTLLAGDDATYGQTYDQFQACVQLQ